MPRALLITLFAVTTLQSGLIPAQEPDDRTPLQVTINAPLIQTRWQDAPSGVTLIDDEICRVDLGALLSQVRPR